MGSFWPLAQNYSKNLEHINFKFSYYKRSNSYWDLELQRGKNPSQFSCMILSQSNILDVFGY